MMSKNQSIVTFIQRKTCILDNTYFNGLAKTMLNWNIAIYIHKWQKYKQIYKWKLQNYI